MKLHSTAFATVASLLAANTHVPHALACTSLLVTPGASTDGSAMVTYTADSITLYGALDHQPAATFEEGAMVDVHEWDTGIWLGQIPQAERTYARMGNMNEHQVAITETTFGGRDDLYVECVEGSGRLDYGSLMFLALQRGSTAREAIQVMDELAAEHGYCGYGENFSVVDPDEVWIMSLVGKGESAGQRKKKKTTGAIWVARRLPDGTVAAHSNQAVVREFPLDDPENCLYSEDVITFAEDNEWYDPSSGAFSFQSAYSPLNLKKLRFSESRTWRLLSRVAPWAGLSTDFIDGVEGAEPPPLWVEPDRKLSLEMVMDLMRDHYEGVEGMDMTVGLGAGPFGRPYRWRPLTWEHDGETYLNPRAISTQQTGYSVVAQARASMPDMVGGVLWFGVDDTYSTVYVPFYCGNSSVAKPFAKDGGNFQEFSWDSAFWVFNAVAAQAYARYRDVIVDIQQVQQELEGSFLAGQAELEAEALALYEQDPEAARARLTEYSNQQALHTVERWRQLWSELFVKYLDFHVRDEKGEPMQLGYPDGWRERLVEDDDKTTRWRVWPAEEAPSGH
jgi:dipeptidase